jgi:hypothetical protein
VSSAGKQEVVKGQATVAADSWTNGTEDDVKRTFEVENTSEVSDELGVEYSAEFEVTVFGQKVKNTITLAYKHEWSSSHTVKDSVGVHHTAQKEGMGHGDPEILSRLGRLHDLAREHDLAPAKRVVRRSDDRA